MANKIFALFVIFLFGAFLVSAALLLPVFGIYQNKIVGNYYLEHGLDETGSANIVNSIVWDYRSYDTLGEETVLIIATIGIVLVAGRRMS